MQPAIPVNCIVPNLRADFSVLILTYLLYNYPTVFVSFFDNISIVPPYKNRQSEHKSPSSTTKSMLRELFIATQSIERRLPDDSLPGKQRSSV